MDVVLLVSAPIALAAVLALPRWALLAGIGYLGIALSRLGLVLVPAYSFAGGLIALLRMKRPTEPLRGLAAYVAVLVAGGLVALIATLWSAVPRESLTAGAYWLALVPITIVVVNEILAHGIGSISKPLALFSPVLIAQAASTVAFRLSPDVERQYYQSSVADFFLRGVNRLLYTEEGHNNVVALDRAGGFLFVSVNRAALVMGVFLMAYLAYAVLSRRRWPLLVALALAVGIVASGSKTGVVLIIVLPVFAFLLSRAAASSKPAGRMGVVMSGLGVAAVAVQLFVSTADEFVTSSAATLEPRLILWSESWRAITENWFLGLGFGGWIERWMSGGVAAPFSARPAHNWLLQAWLDGGIMFAVINVVLVAVVIAMTVRAVSAPASVRVRFGHALAGGGFLWAFAHGLGDNSAVLGNPENHIAIAILGAVLLTSTSRNRHGSLPEHDPETRSSFLRGRKSAVTGIGSRR